MSNPQPTIVPIPKIDFETKKAETAIKLTKEILKKIAVGVVVTVAVALISNAVLDKIDNFGDDEDPS